MKKLFLTIGFSFLLFLGSVFFNGSAIASDLGNQCKIYGGNLGFEDSEIVLCEHLPSPEKVKMFVADCKRISGAQGTSYEDEAICFLPKE